MRGFCSGNGNANTTATYGYPANLHGQRFAGNATGTSIPLSIADAIDRALKYNLETILTDQDTRVARAARLRTLSELLPRVNASVSEYVQQINLAAFGFTSFPGVAPGCGTLQCF